jgi:hypothetical protein
MSRNFIVVASLAGSLAGCQQVPSTAATGAPTPQGTPVASTRTMPQPDVAEFDRQMAEARDNMRKMDQQMAQIHQAQNPQERQRLLQDHWNSMQSTMNMMHGMWGAAMMGCCGTGPAMTSGSSASGASGNMMGHGHRMGSGPMMGWQGMSDYYSQMTPEQQGQRQYMNEQYMGMQQMMMNHMMQHQGWMGQPAQPAQK